MKYYSCKYTDAGKSEEKEEIYSDEKLENFDGITPEEQYKSMLCFFNDSRNAFELERVFASIELYSEDEPNNYRVI